MTRAHAGYGRRRPWAQRRERDAFTQQTGVPLPAHAAFYLVPVLVFPQERASRRVIIRSFVSRSFHWDYSTGCRRASQTPRFG